MDSTKMCRICLAESNDNNQSISIYMKISDVKHRRFSFADQNQQEIITTTPGELTIFDLIISCSLDKDINFDVFPKKICKKCLRDLFAAYLFCTRCNKANDQLKKMLLDESDKSTHQNTCEDNKSTNTIHVDSSDNQHFLASIKESDTDLLQPIDKNYQNSMEISDHDENESMETKQILHIDISNECKKETNETIDEDEVELYEVSIKPYKCDDCKECFNQLDDLNCHWKSCKSISRKSSKKQYNCIMCSQKFSRLKDLKAHSASHGLFKRADPCVICEICSKTVVKQRLTQHMLLTHKIQVFKCRRCEEKFSTNDELNEHTKNHVKQTVFLCPECGKHFKSNNALIGHMRGHTGEMPYKCPQCDKRFSRKYVYDLHLKRHTNEKRHVCETCGKGFIEGAKLKFHMRVHTGERPYKCHFCDRSFAQSNDLKVHIRRHTGERFKCDICDESFIQNYLLSRHKRNAHGINIQSRSGRLNAK